MSSIPCLDQIKTDFFHRFQFPMSPELEEMTKEACRFFGNTALANSFVQLSYTQHLLLTTLKNKLAPLRPGEEELLGQLVGAGSSETKIEEQIRAKRALDEVKNATSATKANP